MRHQPSLINMRRLNDVSTFGKPLHPGDFSATVSATGWDDIGQRRAPVIDLGLLKNPSSNSS